MGWGTAAEFAMRIVDKFVPDPAQKAAHALEIRRMEQEGEFRELDHALALSKQQNDINVEQAKSSSLWVSGPRPGIMWVGAAAMGWQFFIGPMFQWLSTLFGHPTPLPELDTAQLFNLVTLLLGLGAYRSYEKKNGVATQ
jgi:hypothetical protein